jgi:hypothetical protein
MTEEELKRIENYMSTHGRQCRCPWYEVEIRDLIAEVRRLRKELDDWECSEDRENGHLNSAQPFWSSPSNEARKPWNISDVTFAPTSVVVPMGAVLYNDETGERIAEITFNAGAEPSP